MFKKFSLNRKIKKAVKKTVSQFSNSTPRISMHFFYGAVDLGPENLVIWYLFRTDGELEAAKANGLCQKLEQTTIANLRDFGYPEDAFAVKTINPSNQISFANGTDEQKNEILDSLTHRSAAIAFTTEEDVDKKANGNYYLYFK